ncbi:MAG: InlB B-repeat-containing protein [Coriobacteriia bacterium]|nr:InlB B-repeat-containing protein [Coriobacteriia bacterium]
MATHALFGFRKRGLLQKAVSLLVASAFLLSFALPVTQATAATVEYWVDGSVPATGTGTSLGSPFKTLDEVFAKIGVGNGYTGIVHIAPGDYTMTTIAADTTNIGGTSAPSSTCKWLYNCAISFEGSGISGANQTRLFASGTGTNLFTVSGGSAVSFKDILFDGARNGTTGTKTYGFNAVNNYSGPALNAPITFTNCAIQNINATSGMFINLNNSKVDINGLTVNTVMPDVVDAARTAFNNVNRVTVGPQPITLLPAAAATAFAARTAAEVAQVAGKNFEYINLTDEYCYQIPLSSGTRALAYVPNLPQNSGGSATTLSLSSASANGTTINLTPRVNVSSPLSTLSRLISQTKAHAIIATDSSLAPGDMLTSDDTARIHIADSPISGDPETPTDIGWKATISSGYNLGSTSGSMAAGSFNWGASWPDTLYLALVDNIASGSAVDGAGGNVYAVLPITRVHFDANRGSGAGTGTMEDVVAAVDSSPNLPANTFTNGASTFAGWNTKADGSGTPYANSAALAPVTADGFTLYAQWTHNVVYDGNGSTGGSVPVDSADYAAGEEVTVLGKGSLVKDGYSFLGWSTDEDATTPEYKADDSFPMPNTDDDVTLYAVWQVIPKAHVLYNGNGSTGGIVPLDPNSYAEGDPVTVLFNTGNLAKDGYRLLGWSTDKDATTAEYMAGDNFAMPNTDKDTTLYAVWQVIPKAHVLYNGNGNTGGVVPLDPNSYAEGDPVTVLFNTGGLVKDGYRLLGWSTNKGATTAKYKAGDSFLMPNANKDTVLYAVWKVIPPAPTFNVMFNSRGGSNVPTQLGITPDGKIIKPADPTRAGYIFTGWYKDPGCTVPWDFANDTVGANTVLYAGWKKVTPKPPTPKPLTPPKKPISGLPLAGDSVSATWISCLIVAILASLGAVAIRRRRAN